MPESFLDFLVSSRYHYVDEGRGCWQVPHESDWRIPAAPDTVGGGDNSLVPLAEGETESFLHALFLGAPPFAHRQNRAVPPCPTGG